MVRSVLVVVLLLVGCSAGAPPTASPAPPTAGPTAAPTSAPTSAPAATPTNAPYCNPDYYDCSSHSPAPTAGTGGGDLVIGATPGGILVDSAGLSLYTNDNDSADSSICYTGCVDSWPPLTLSDGQQASGGAGVSGAFSTLSRDDGTTQVVYNGKPLYYFVGDNAPGDVNGDGLGEVWHLATP